MKRYFLTYVKAFFITNLFLILLQAGIVRRLNIRYDYLPIIIGAMIIAIFLGLGSIIFKREKGASWLNLILGFIVILPSLFVIKFLFGIIIFRFSFVIYLFVIFMAIVYSILVFFATKKARAEVKEMNELLNKEKNKEE
ncbi:MAG: DUF3021 family protein [Firmicutes bacterium]|nr:DUF3021 family protein [Bacillota bacterium]